MTFVQLKVIIKQKIYNLKSNYVVKIVKNIFCIENLSVNKQT